MLLVLLVLRALWQLRLMLLGLLEMGWCAHKWLVVLQRKAMTGWLCAFQLRRGLGRG